MKHKKHGGAGAADKVVVGGYRGRQPLSKKWLFVSLAGAALLLVIVLGWAFLSISDNLNQGYDTTSPEYERLARIQDEPIPDGDREKFTYYLHLADAYDGLDDTKAALEAALKADSYIKDRSIATGQTANIAIARYYEKLGDKAKAHNYLQREIDRIKSDPSAGENKEVIKVIETMQKELQ